MPTGCHPPAPAQLEEVKTSNPVPAASGTISAAVTEPPTTPGSVKPEVDVTMIELPSFSVRSTRMVAGAELSVVRVVFP